MDVGIIAVKFDWIGVFPAIYDSDEHPMRPFASAFNN
jgi:hypothetical protein